MTINDLSVNFEHLDRATILSDWAWFTPHFTNLIMITVAGDAFLQSSETGEVLFLDTVDCKIEAVATSPDEFMTL